MIYFLFSDVLYEKEIFKTKKFMLKKQLRLGKLARELQECHLGVFEFSFDSCHVYVHAHVNL